MAREEAAVLPSGVRLLLRTRLLALRNHSLDAVRASPIRIASTAGFILLIWAGIVWYLIRIDKKIKQLEDHFTKG